MQGSPTVVYKGKYNPGTGANFNTLDAKEFLVLLLIHTPAPYEARIRYFGAASSTARRGQGKAEQPSDVEEDTFNLDPELIEAKITDRTKIIFPLHSQGHPADMDPIIEIAEKYGIQVFENIVHAMGGKYKGRKLPVTEAGSTSFSLKCLWLPGGGGMVITDNDELAEAVSLPVIASGGAGTLEHLYEAITEAKADAVLVASVFHFGKHTIAEAKEYLAKKGIPVRR